MTKSIAVTLELDQEVLELLDETTEESGEGRDKGVSTIISLWAYQGMRDEDELFDRYIAGAKMGVGLIHKYNLIFIFLIIAGSWVSNRLSELVTFVPVFIGSYVIFFIIRIFDNIRLERKWRSPDQMLKSLQK